VPRRQLLARQLRQLGPQRLVVSGGLGAIPGSRFGDVGNRLALGSGRRSTWISGVAYRWVSSRVREVATYISCLSVLGSAMT
jgi:hypothetical protein